MNKNDTFKFECGDVVKATSEWPPSGIKAGDLLQFCQEANGGMLRVINFADKLRRIVDVSETRCVFEQRPRRIF